MENWVPYISNQLTSRWFTKNVPVAESLNTRYLLLNTNQAFN
jgi:hypothetical protein